MSHHLPGAAPSPKTPLLDSRHLAADSGEATSQEAGALGERKQDLLSTSHEPGSRTISPHPQQPSGDGVIVSAQALQVRKCRFRELTGLAQGETGGLKATSESRACTLCTQASTEICGAFLAGVFVGRLGQAESRLLAGGSQVGSQVQPLCVDPKLWPPAANPESQ